jgi:N-acetylmuramoyl-L-alanine amidase
VSKFVVHFFVVLTLLALAGCTTAPKTGTGETAPDQTPAPTGVPANWSVNPPVLKPTPIHSNPPPASVVRTNLSAGVHTNPPIVKNPANTNIIVSPAITWTSLNAWAKDHKVEEPRRLTTSPVTTYATATTNGVFVLTIGTRDATWRGTELHLGFAPEFADGQIFVHALDLEKNIQPLLLHDPHLDYVTNRVIVIDPGHGGMNGGTISVNDGRAEKEFTIDLARRVQRLLESEGWQVFLTRTNGDDVALSNRVSFAESHHADLFISLHFNSAAPDKKQSGLETFCLTPTGMPSTLTRGYPDVLTDHYPNNQFDSENIRLALRLHKAVLRATGEEDRGVRRARFLGVLRGQRRPAILIEGGYLSNPHEAERIENPDFRQAIAEGIANALK